MKKQDLEIIEGIDDFVVLHRQKNACKECGGTGKVFDANIMYNICPKCSGSGMRKHD